MEWVCKALLLGLTAGLLALTMEKTVPVMSLLLGVAASVMILTLGITLMDPILSFVTRLHLVLGASGVYTAPLLKCFAIAVMTRLGSSLCRDAKQSGAAAALEITGAAAAVWSALPLMEAFLSMLEALL